MGNPLFDPSDRVPNTPSGLPEELKGKSPEEVAAYYQRRQSELQAENEALKNRPAPAPTVIHQPPPPPSPEISSAEFWNNPVEATKRLIAQQGVGRDEFERAGVNVQANMIDAAEPFQRANPHLWDMSYTHIKGRNADRLVAEARAQALLPTEPVTPGGTPPPPAKELTAEEARVAAKLGMDNAKYLQAKERMERGEWPQTTNNVQR